MKAVVFDMDGVIVDTVEAWRSTFNLTLKHFRKRLVIPEEDFKNKVFGVDSGAFFKSIGCKEWAQMRMFNYSNFTRFKDKVTLDENAIFVLKRIRSSGLKTALVTSSPRSIVNALLEHYKLTQFFDTTITGDEVPAKKPDPSGILKACSLLGVSPKDAMYVGDTNSDILAAKAAGIPLAMLSTTIGIDAIHDVQHKLNSLVDILDIVEKK